MQGTMNLYSLLEEICIDQIDDRENNRTTFLFQIRNHLHAAELGPEDKDMQYFSVDMAHWFYLRAK